MIVTCIMLLLDASEAFDVNEFRDLREHKRCPTVLRLLMNTYVNQYLQVICNYFKDLNIFYTDQDIYNYGHYGYKFAGTIISIHFTFFYCLYSPLNSYRIFSGYMT